MTPLLILLIKKYQAILSPLLTYLGVRCVYRPTCSQYAIRCLRENSVRVAIPLILKRIINCKPQMSHIRGY